MNKKRRKALSDVLAMLAEARELLSAISDEEQAAYDDMPATFQDGARGQAMQETIDALMQAVDELESLEDNLTNITEGA